MRYAPLFLFAIIGAPERSEENPIKALQAARVAHAKAQAALKAAEDDLKAAEGRVQALIQDRQEDLKALKEALAGDDEKPPIRKRPVRKPSKKKSVEKDDKSQAPAQKREYAMTEREREVAEKTAEERRARREGQQTQDKALVATLEMKIPARARVWIGGKRKRDSGKERSYTSPALKEGEEYTFKVRIRWKDQEVKRSVTVKAGETMILAVGKARAK